MRTHKYINSQHAGKTLLNFIGPHLYGFAVRTKIN
jgi:hypothetical protein